MMSSRCNVLAVPSSLLCLALALLAACPSRAARRTANQKPKEKLVRVFSAADSWQATMLASRTKFLEKGLAPNSLSALVLWDDIWRRYPVQVDWMWQDLDNDRSTWFTDQQAVGLEKRLIEKPLAEAGDAAVGLRKELEALVGAKTPRTDGRWLDLYVKACELRRTKRLATLQAKAPRFVFTKHYNMGASHYAYTEGQSDAQRERHFRPGSALCLFELDGIYGKVTTLIDDRQGVIRDPDVSYDGNRILFAWKKSDRLDDYHLYEMDLAKGEVRQLTFGLGFADYEGCYLPNGDIVFNSTRCVQTVDCWWTEVSNLYTCGPDGEFLRRLTFDQVHDNYPQVLPDGRLVYTRWEYNDRGQLYPQPLYQMNPDGTGQAEHYGNNSWFPTTIMHARGIAGSEKIIALASGHHSRQAGKLILVDRRKGTQENEGVQLIAPIRETKAVRVDAYGQKGELFQYPYALNEREYLVTYMPGGWQQRPPFFAIYAMDIDGRRELLTADPAQSCNQSVPLMARAIPHPRPSTVDYRKKTGVYYLQDVYAGPSLKGITPGTVKKIRVVSIDYRAAGIGANGNGGPAGGALVSTPISVGNGSWDPKIVLGDATVYEDGSAMFTVPARTPVYFQAIDERGCAVQTMRSWSTLQPGEFFSCVGCHESKGETPDAARSASIAMRTGPQSLEPFYGPARGFSFPKEIQPILDKHCIRCHRARGATASGGGAAGVKPTASHTHASDAVTAMCDGRKPKNSDDHDIPRFTWWAHRGTQEWVQYDFEAPRLVNAVSVYWFDDRPRGGRCRIPESWRLMVRKGRDWVEVKARGKYGVERDRFNKVQFDPVVTTALRIEVKLQAEYSSGILEWQVTSEDASMIALTPREAEWRYTTAAPDRGWEKPGFADAQWEKGRAGFGRRGTPGGRQHSQWHTPEIWMRREFDVPQELVGAELTVDVCHDEDVEVYVNGVEIFKAKSFITKFRQAKVGAYCGLALNAGKNTIAVHCRQTSGGQFIDVALMAKATLPEPVEEEKQAKPPAPKAVFSLLGTGNTDVGAKRDWSDAYLALTHSSPGRRGTRGRSTPRVNWISAQSIPPLLPPYHAGAAKSSLFTMLEKGHNNVKLSREELDKIACWIDLLIPYCGDYREANAWSDGEKANYDHFENKRLRMAAIEQQNIQAMLGAAKAHASATLKAEILAADGKVLTSQPLQGVPGKTAIWELRHTFANGERIRITGAENLAVTLDALLPEAAVFAPGGVFEFPVPPRPVKGKRYGQPFPPQAFAGDSHKLRVRVLSAADRGRYHNLALNPYAPTKEGKLFPRATTNSVCRSEPAFAARNAIDGAVRNDGHGPWPMQSWGPDKREDLWWQVDFGRQVEVDRATVTIRADFPHDQHWERADLIFSDGHKQSIRIQKTGAPQVFTFRPRRTTSVKIANLVQKKPLGWCALTEVEVWGRDIIEVKPGLAGTTQRPVLDRNRPVPTRMPGRVAAGVGLLARSPARRLGLVHCP